MLTTVPTRPGFDYLSLLQSDLSKLGQSYSVVATLPEFNATAPSDAGFLVSVARATRFSSRQRQREAY